MASGVAPVKVDVETDALISHAAHFLDKSKKDVVDAAKLAELGGMTE